ncbi:MAG TPA: lysylphosphatidylglycerol synthase domain-containing protein [Gaiellaceae bacterium]|jgi:uncharacterized membrane protein YbhN (UPF0104 family)|nr:lysylphosphatidylglycerol synthase domain-containing protein [Gaiellaceae bacterium]
MTLLAGFGGGVAAAAERMQEVDPRYAGIALALQLAHLGLRALAWRGALAAAYPRARPALFPVACAYAAGVGLNAFLPARGGEAAKVALVRAQLPGSSVPTIAASLAVLTMLDAVVGASLIVALWATGVLPALPSVPGVGLVPAAAAAGIGGLAVLALAARRLRAALRRVLAAAAHGLAVLRDPRRCARTVLPFHLAAWACRIGVVFFVLRAFQVETGLETAALLTVLSGAATTVPVPGGAGSQQVLAVWALQGISTAAAVSVSVGMQLGLTVVNTAVGLAGAMLLLRTLRPAVALRGLRRRSSLP